MQGWEISVLPILQINPYVIKYTANRIMKASYSLAVLQTSSVEVPA